MEYLHNTLGQTLQTIINSKQPCEIDITKLENGDGATLDKNLETLTNFMDLLLRANFNSQNQLPQHLRELFKIIETEARNKFPDEESVKYTSVTGFLFLRF